MPRKSNPDRAATLAGNTRDTGPHGDARGEVYAFPLSDPRPVAPSTRPDLHVKRLRRGSAVFEELRTPVWAGIQGLIQEYRWDDLQEVRP